MDDFLGRMLCGLPQNSKEHLDVALVSGHVRGQNFPNFYEVAMGQRS